MPNKTTIRDALKQVIGESGHPLTAKEAYESIVDRGLYEFGAKNPLAVVQSQLRKSAVGVQSKTGTRIKHFELVEGNKYKTL